MSRSSDPPDDDHPSIDPRIRQRRLAIRRSEGRRRLRWVIAAVGLVVLVGLVAALLHTPWFSARVVTVVGAHPHTTTAAIVDAAGLEHHPALISVNPGAVAARVEALPAIDSVTVSRLWPDHVQIAVTERAAVAQMAGPGMSWSIVDGQGRTLQVASAQVPGLPVFAAHSTTGTIGPARVGRSLPPDVEGGLVVARTLPRAFSAQVASVTLASDDTISLGLTSGITALLGPATDLPAKYEDVAAILAQGTLHPTSTIDATVPASPTVSG